MEEREGTANVSKASLKKVKIITPAVEKVSPFTQETTKPLLI